RLGAEAGGGRLVADPPPLGESDLGGEGLRGPDEEGVEGRDIEPMELPDDGGEDLECAAGVERRGRAPLEGDVPGEFACLLVVERGLGEPDQDSPEDLARGLAGEGRCEDSLSGLAMREEPDDARRDPEGLTRPRG